MATEDQDEGIILSLIFTIDDFHKLVGSDSLITYIDSTDHSDNYVLENSITSIS
jgi:hypothetical protein